MPVDQYIGGINMLFALLYSRFFMKALSYENDQLNLSEPLTFLLKEWFVMKHKDPIITG